LELLGGVFVAGLTYANQVGAPEGLNQAAPGTFIPESFVRWAQDILFDRAGLLRRRAPFKTVDLYSFDGTRFDFPDAQAQRVLGVISTLNPNNEVRIGIIVSGGNPPATRILFYDKNYRKTCFCQINNVSSDSTIVFSRPALNGGVFIGVLENYGKHVPGVNESWLYYWRGGTGIGGTQNTATTFSIASGAGANSVYGDYIDSDITNRFDPNAISPGMFVYRVDGTDEYYIGTVKEVTANRLTLEKSIIRTALDPISGTPYNSDNTNARDNQTIRFVNVRPYIHSHGRGLVTYDGASGPALVSGNLGTSGEGHFAAAGLNNTWALYRASDGTWLGDIDNVASNTALSFNSTRRNTSIKMNADEYTARPYGVSINDSEAAAGVDPTRFTGVFNTTYAGYQWFGNSRTLDTQNRIVFSSDHDPESVDLSRDAADSIVLPGVQQMRGMASSNAGLVVFLEDITYLVRGNNRFNFAVEELYPEGCLSANSIVEYGGGVFWASKNGILYFDGASVRNLTVNNLGAYYTDSIRAFDAQVDRIFSFLYKDYLFVSFSALNSAYKPIRYEPIYAEGIDNTPAIQDYQADDWDPAFSVDDFNPENNVPIYWDYIKMYESLGLADVGDPPTWGEGFSYPIASMTAGSPIIGNIDSTLTSPGGYSIGLGDYVIGANLSSVGIIQSIDTINDTITLTSPVVAVNTESSTIQIVPNLIGNVWSKALDFVWGPVNQTEGITFAIYLPTNAISVISNFNFRGFIKLDSIAGVRGLAGVNAVNGDFYNITSATRVGTTVTLVVPSHKLSANNVVTIEGLGVPFDGTFSIVTATGPVDNPANTLTYTIPTPDPGDPLLSDLPGTIRLEGTYARLIEVDSMLQFNNAHEVPEDSELIENLGKKPEAYVKGPDFYLQTKHYSFGDPTLRKWFRQLFLNLYLLDGGLRMDVVDNEDNDRIDIERKRRVNWELFDEEVYRWAFLEDVVFPKILSPDRSTWQNIDAKNQSWYELTDAAFERRKKKFSWRYPTMGFRLYQMNKFRPINYQTPQRPHTVMVDSWSVGYKPMRQSRV
jgi:hypothetical protein